jgi:RimJ/RimL family protein N-acetyltransferase
MTNGRLSTPTGRTFGVRGCEISIFARKHIQHSESMVGFDRPSNNGIRRTASLAAPSLMPTVGHGDGELNVRIVRKEDREWVTSLLRERWGSPQIVTRGNVHYADGLPGFIAMEAEQRVGLVTYRLQGGDCEIVSLDSLTPGQGIGTALVKAVVNLAANRGCHRVWLVTTNDNTAAIRFYQKIGFALVAIHRCAITESRRLKPGIPERGSDGIPIRDEIELEIETR